MTVRRTEWKAFWTFFLLMATTLILLVHFVDPVTSSSAQPSPRRLLVHGGRVQRLSKKSSPPHLPSTLSPRARIRTVVANNNSSRNARQVPEIPALYSAPKVQPDLPALYSAPKPLDDNDVDDQMIRGTTEISLDDENSAEDETSSEDYQYLPPTEKSPRANDDNDPMSQDEEEDAAAQIPTDAPIPQATYLPPKSRTSEKDDDEEAEFDEDNESNDEPTENSYGGYGGKQEPSPQYGPPQANSRKNGNGAKPESSSSPARGRGGGGEGNPADNNRRPSDQQQIENSVQPMTRQHQGNSGEPQPGYLPPVYHPPAAPQQQQNAPQVPPSAPQPKQGKEAQSSNPNQGYDSHNRVEEYGQQPPNPNYYTLPQEAPPQDLGQQSRLPSQQPQGQGYFGNVNNNNQIQEPSPVYGPPRALNHFHQQQQQPSPGLGSVVGNSIGSAEEEELEGLNEKIVDAELLERVQQIIEEHERQQKQVLEQLQKDNENAIFSSGPSSPQGYPTGGSNGGGNELSSFPFYGPPSSPSTSPHNGNGNNNNGYSNNNNSPPGTYLPPPSGGGGNNGASTTKQLSPDVQVQKAVLSRHFTETEPASQTTSAGGGGGGYKSEQQHHQLNSVAGPGTEYLPPSSTSQNSGYSTSGKDNEGYNVKVGAGLSVGGVDSSSGPSPIYGVPSSAPTSSGSLGYQNPRPNTSPVSAGEHQRFPSQYPAAQQQQQPQHFPNSPFPSRNPSSPAPRYGPPEPVQYSTSGHAGGDNNPERSAASQYLPPGNRVMMITVPRPVYGVPLAPVITLDGENDLQAGPTNTDPSGSPYYLAPSPSAPGAAGPTYGFMTSTSHPSPTSSSSAYLMIQGHQGISNAFSLPIYDYSPNAQNVLPEHQELVGQATSHLEQLLQQQQQQHPQPPHNVLSLPESFFYGESNVVNRRQDNFRVSRRAIQRKATISPTTFSSNNNNNQGRPSRKNRNARNSNNQRNKA